MANGSCLDTIIIFFEERTETPLCVNTQVNVETLHGLGLQYYMYHVVGIKFSSIVPSVAGIKATLAGTTSKKCTHPRSAGELSFKAPKKLKQMSPKTYRGLDIPFSKEETGSIQAQGLQAVSLSNLPFWAMGNLDMLKAFCDVSNSSI